MEITGYKDKHEWTNKNGVTSVIYLMDCMEGLKQIPDNYFDLIITSPPYNLGETHHTGGKRFKAYNTYSDNLPEGEYKQNQIAILNQLLRITNTEGSLLYNHKNRIKQGVQLTPYEWILKTDWLIKQEIIWFNRSQNFDKCRFYPMTERIYWLSKTTKTNFVNNINSHDIIEQSGEGTNKVHKRAFPLKLIEKLIKCFPNNKVCLDPYSGSGTTRIACQKAGLEFIGFELDPGHFYDSVKRFKIYAAQGIIF